MIDIEAINVDAGVVLLSTGDTVLIDVYLDDEGDECSRYDNVAAIVVRLPDGKWASCPVDAFESVTVH